MPGSTYRVKDFASHLASLDPQLVRWFEAVREGKTEQPSEAAQDGSPFDVDRFNDRVVAERRDWSLAQIFDEAADNRKLFLEALQELDDEMIEQVVHFNGDNKRPSADIPFKLFLSGLTRHDPIHVADMLKALPERASDAEITAWVEHPVVKHYQAAMEGPARK